LVNAGGQGTEGHGGGNLPVGRIGVALLLRFVLAGILTAAERVGAVVAGITLVGFVDVRTVR
jgi:hypothetical protein